MPSDAITARPGATRKRRAGLVGKGSIAIFVVPFVVLFVAMYIAPILYAAGKSLFALHRSGLGLAPPTLKFDPWSNYSRAFHDGAFTGGLLRVLIFGIVQVPVMLALALSLALLLDSRSAKAKSFFRLSSFLPYAVPGVSAALVWSFMYTPQSSPINHLLGHLDASIAFFSPTVVLWSVANIVTWAWTGYNMLIIYSSLQTVPEEVIEAARLDGAGAWRIAWSVKVPMVRSTLVLTTIFSIIGSAQLFNEPTVLQPISQGSIASTYTPIMSAQVAATGGDYPYAAAQSVILAVLVGAISLIFFKLTRRGDDSL